MNKNSHKQAYCKDLHFYFCMHCQIIFKIMNREKKFNYEFDSEFEAVRYERILDWLKIN